MKQHVRKGQAAKKIRQERAANPPGAQIWIEATAGKVGDQGTWVKLGRYGSGK